MGGEVKSVQNFGGKPERTTPLGRPRHVWNGDIEMDLIRGMG
jgi:hypothetical protein